MKSIQLSIEELIFAFYSEGLYEQGISLKEVYFPDMKDAELKLILECASRSLMAKNMVEEKDNLYKLKNEIVDFIHIINHAESTVKASRFILESETEDSLSYHRKGDSFYLHRLLYEQQVHQISKVSEKELFNTINSYFDGNYDNEESKVLFSIKIEEFEELLGNLSQIESQTATKEELLENHFYDEFLIDLKSRNCKMDSILYMEYDKENMPDLMDVCFIIPGKDRTWFVSRGPENDYIFQNWNQRPLKDILFKNQSISV